MLHVRLARASFKVQSGAANQRRRLFSPWLILHLLFFFSSSGGTGVSKYIAMIYKGIAGNARRDLLRVELLKENLPKICMPIFSDKKKKKYPPNIRPPAELITLCVMNIFSPAKR